MREHLKAFIVSAADAFRLRGPICRIEFHGCRTSGSDDPELGALLRTRFGQLADVGFPADHREQAFRLPFPHGVMRTVLCVGGPPLDAQRERAAEEIRRVLAPGGALLACVPAPDPEPRPTFASWQPTPQTVARLLEGMDATLVGWQGAETRPHTMYGVGFKPPVTRAAVEGTSRFLDDFQTKLERARKGRNWRARLWRFLSRRLPARSARRRVDDHRVRFLVHLTLDRSVVQGVSLGGFHSEKTGTRLDLMD